MEELGNSLDKVVEIFEKNIIEKALKDSRGDLTNAAFLLKITKRKIQYKIAKYGIDYQAIKAEYGPSTYILDFVRNFSKRKHAGSYPGLSPQ